MLLLIAKVIPGDLIREVRAALDEEDFADGRETAQGGARSIKSNRQLLATNETAGRLGQRLVDALNGHDGFRSITMPATIALPTFARYGKGMAYGQHVDGPVFGQPPTRLRTDISVTIFLADATEYQGGELVLHLAEGPRPAKGDAGDVLIYPSQTVHEVRPLIDGVRLVAVTWIQSMIRDPERRALLHDLGVALKGFEEGGEHPNEIMLLRKSRNNLMRMWADV